MKDSIPVIDLDKISDQVKRNKLREACEKWGCFRIINHSVPATLMAEMMMVVGTLFDLPMEIKMRKVSAGYGSGYTPPCVADPLHKALSLYDLGSSQARHEFCSQLNASPHQSWEIMEEYGKTIHDLAVKIGQKMAESLGIQGVDSGDWPCQYRVNKYSFTLEAIGLFEIKLHTDSGFLTILQDDENVGGLEVMDSSDSFVPLPPFPGSLLANLGDVAHAWSNGRFCYVKHRVQCKEATTRFSIATFMLAPRNGNVEAPAEVVDHDHPRVYQPFNFEEYWMLRFSKTMHTGEALELLRLT